MVTQDPDVPSASIDLNTAFREKRNRSDSSITSSLSTENELKKPHLDNNTVNDVVDGIISSAQQEMSRNVPRDVPNTANSCIRL